jgi:hypothetical protein
VNYHEHGDLLNSACALLHPRRLQLGARASLMRLPSIILDFTNLNYHEHGDLLNSACALLHPRRLQLGATASLMEAAIYYVGILES